MHPNLLADYLHFHNQGIASDAIVQHLSHGVAAEHDISTTWAEEIIRYHLTKSGVTL
jgi:hypothetical protein